MCETTPVSVNALVTDVKAYLQPCNKPFECTNCLNWRHNYGSSCNGNNQSSLVLQNKIVKMFVTQKDVITTLENAINNNNNNTGNTISIAP